MVKISRGWIQYMPLKSNHHPRHLVVGVGKNYQGDVQNYIDCQCIQEDEEEERVGDLESRDNEKENEVMKENPIDRVRDVDVEVGHVGEASEKKESDNL